MWMSINSGPGIMFAVRFAMIQSEPAITSNTTSKAERERQDVALALMPSCSGTAKFMSPTTKGIAMKKIMRVPVRREELVEVLGRQVPQGAARGDRPPARNT